MEGASSYDILVIFFAVLGEYRGIEFAKAIHPKGQVYHLKNWNIMVLFMIVLKWSITNYS